MNKQAHTRYSGVNHPLSFSLHLIRNFTLSTFVPMILAMYLITYLFYSQQRDEILKATHSHLASLERNIYVYLQELEHVTLMPYYDENFSLYLSQANTEKKLSYPERFRIRQSLDNTINFIRYTRSDLQNVIIVYEDRCLYSSMELVNTAIVSGYDYGGEAWYQEALKSDGNVVFVPAHIPAYYDRQDTTLLFSMARSLVNLRTRIPYAVIKVDAKAAIFEDLLSNAEFYAGSKLLLLDSYQQPIYMSGFTSEALSKWMDTDWEKSGRVSVEKCAMLHETIEIKHYNWSLHVFLDEMTLGQQRVWMLALTLLVYFISLLFMLFSYLALSKKMVRSIRSMRNTLARIQQGDFSVRYIPQTRDELAAVGLSINSMAQQIEALIEREYINAIRQKEAELKALRSQIQPHFIFNVLGNLIALNQINDTKRLGASLFSLSTLMRYALDQSDMVELADEIRFVREYMNLQKLRFGDKLNCSFDLEQDAERFSVPRLLLQPYIENAVIHGIEPATHPCTITIKANLEPDGLIIQVTDDGVGFDSIHSSGIGIQNTLSRLQLHYPDSQMEISSSPGMGCKIKLNIRGGSA